MRYFQKLIIENFQSHEYTEIDFVPGLNVFVGPSDSGKSSILRALRWVLFNQPRGVDFIRTGATKCQVRLILDDGTEIIRVRGKSVNRYIVRTAEGNEEVYEGFGQGSHPMILQVHQMIPLTWDQKETYLQFSSQLEGPFLLSESGGAKAKLIGRISGAHWIDLALKEATRERNQLMSEMRQVEKQKESIRERLEPYQNVPELESTVQKAFERFKYAQRRREKLERLLSFAKKLEVNDQAQQDQKKRLQAVQHLSLLEKNQVQNEQRMEQLRKLNQLFQQNERVREEKRLNQYVCQQTDRIAETERSFLHISNEKGKWLRLKQIAKRFKQYQHAKLKNQRQLHLLREIPVLTRESEALSGKIEYVQRLQKINESLFHVRSAKKEYKLTLNQTQEAFRWSQEMLPTVEQRLTQYGQLINLQKRYQENQRNRSVGRQFLEERIRKIEESLHSYVELFKRSGRCPTCGSPVNASLLEHLEQELVGGDKYAAVGRANEGSKRDA